MNVTFFPSLPASSLVPQSEEDGEQVAEVKNGFLIVFSTALNTNVLSEKMCHTTRCHSLFAISNGRKKNVEKRWEKGIKHRLEINYLLSGALFSDPFSLIMESRGAFVISLNEGEINIASIKCFLLFTKLGKSLVTGGEEQWPVTLNITFMKLHVLIFPLRWLHPLFIALCSALQTTARGNKIENINFFTRFWRQQNSYNGIVADSCREQGKLWKLMTLRKLDTNLLFGTSIMKGFSKAFMSVSKSREFA